MPTQEPSILWQIAERFGFPAAVSVLLITFIWVRGREITAELGRLTRAVALAVLAMQFAPEFHKQAKELHEESLEAARKRKEDLSRERRDE